MRTRRGNFVLVGLVGCALILSAAAGMAAPVEIKLPADTSKLRESTLPGYAVAQQKCGICHSADYVNYQAPDLTLTQWTAEMNKMQHAYGAPLDADEIKQLGAYLAVTYGSAHANDPEVVAITEAAKKTRDNTTAVDSAAAIDVQQLLTANACLGCHALDHKVVGPGFNEVAKKYAGDAAAPAKLANSIRQGGAGKWGQIAMPPMAALNEAQLNALTDFILQQ